MTRKGETPGPVTPEIWHSHVYFDDTTHNLAETLGTRMQAHFLADAEIIYGRWHHQPVGPHPDFSIQLAFPHAQFAAVMVWLCLLYTSPSPRDATLSRMPSSA